MSQQYQYLPKIDRVIVEANVKYVVWGVVACSVAWAWLIIQSAGVVEVGINVGPGMEPLLPMLNLIAQAADNSAVVRAIVRLCTPQTSAAANLVGVLIMWGAMCVAMMLPSAMPMFKTYADIANLAHQKSKQAAPVWVLVAGYLVSWAVFAVIAAVAQVGAIQYGWVSGISPQYQIAPVALIGAGVYQFSPLKYACLKKCQNPFATLFAQWKTTNAGVFGIGIKQGLYCIGCCWALMLVMLVVGTMNIAWMALFALITIVEKNDDYGKIISIITGTAFIIGGMLAIIYIR